MSRAVVLLSGGIDSSVIAVQAMAECGEVIAVSYDYGQRNIRELAAAREVARRLEIREHFIVDVNLSGWGGSLLTEPSDRVLAAQPTSGLTTHVPGRNTV